MTKTFKPMCNHKFKKDENKSCKWDDFFLQMRLKETGIPNNKLCLPHDSTGECIFHSCDLEWKRENNFTDWLNKLIFFLDNYDNENDEIILDDVIFVGNSLLEKQDSKHTIRTDSENELYCFMFEKMFCKKSIILNNAQFEDIIILERCLLKNDLILQNCLFSKGISIERFTIGGDLHIYDCHFQKRMVISDNDRVNTIYGGWYVENSCFAGDTGFSDLLITERCIIKNNEFKHKEEEIYFTCKFSAGVEFSNNSVTNLMFSGCIFFDDNLFSELELLGKFSMYNPTIWGELKFVGSKDNLLFTPKTTIEIDSECFEERGKITFEYCNLFNLGSIFTENYHSLIKSHKIVRGDGCKMHRICSPTITIPSNSINHTIIVELTTSFSNYFLFSNGRNLGVEFISDKTADLQFYYYTEEDITVEEFMSQLKKTENEYWDFSKIDKNAITENLSQNSTFITHNLLPKISILSQISVLQYYGLWADLDTRWLLKSISYDNDSVREEKIIQTINTYIINMGNSRDSSVVVGNGTATIDKSIKVGDGSNAAINGSQITNTEINQEKKKSLTKGICIGVITAVVARAIWYFIEKFIE